MSAASIDIGTSSASQDESIDSSQPFMLGEWRIVIQTRGEQEDQTAHAHTGLAALLVDCGEYEEAEHHARTALAILDRIGAATRPYVASAQQVLAEALLAQNRWGEADALLRLEIKLLESTGGSELRLGPAASTLGEALLKIGRLDEAASFIAYADEKLPHRKGWPVERELRKLDERKEKLVQARSGSLTPSHALSRTHDAGAKQR